jgi:hypothetical protein
MPSLQLLSQAPDAHQGQITPGAGRAGGVTLRAPQLVNKALVGERGELLQDLIASHEVVPDF